MKDIQNKEKAKHSDPVVEFACEANSVFIIDYVINETPTWKMGKYLLNEKLIIRICFALQKNYSGQVTH